MRYGQGFGGADGLGRGGGVTTGGSGKRLQQIIQ